MVTGAPPYTNALRPRITIKTVDGADTLYTYDSFSSSNNINVGYCDMESAVSETGTFNIMIQDHNNLIPKDNIHNVKVFLELGKTDTSYQTFLIGYGDIISVDRAQTNSQIYNLNGFGSALWAYQLFIHRRETYRKDESDAKIYNIIDNALTKRKWRPLKENDDSVQDITGWSRDGISNEVNIPFTVINKPFTYFGDLCDELCEISGAVWFIDCSSGSEVFTLSYSPALQVPVTIKSGDLADRVNDNPATTSYIKGAFNVQDNATNEAGVSTRLFTVSVQDEVQIFEQDDNNGATNTVMRAIGQQVVIDNDSRRIESIELLLSKNGDPESPKDRLNGDVVLDNGSNKPSTQVLDEFHIDLGSIEHDAKFVKVPVDIKAKDLDVAQAKIWVRIFQRSGNQAYIDAHSGTHLGDPVNDNANCIQWRHNNVLNTNQTIYSGTSTTGGGDVDAKGTMTWNTTNLGPLYGLRINSNIRRLFARTNKKAANAIRLRETFIPTDFLEDPNDVTRYLSLILSQTSKARRAVSEFRVTIPDNFLFRAYQLVGFSDGLSEISDTLRVQRARYVCGSFGGDAQIGALHCDLTLSGLYNTLVGSCTCV